MFRRIEVDAKLGNGTLEILRLHLAKNEITCNPFLDFVEGRISAYTFTPNLLVENTTLLKFKYRLEN